MTTLNDLFNAVDAIGSKYQSDEERAAYQAELNAVHADIVKFATLMDAADECQDLYDALPVAVQTTIATEVILAPITAKPGQTRWQALIEYTA